MRASLFITCNTLHSLTQVWHINEEGNTLGLDKKKTTAVESASYYFWLYCFGADSISKEVAVFSPLLFPQGKTLCSLSLMFDYRACYSLRYDPKII